MTQLKRQAVTLNLTEIQKLKQVEEVRPDLVNCNVSKKIHVVLQEWLRVNLKRNSKKNEDGDPVM